MIKTSQCILEFPPEELDFKKWQRLVNMMAKLFNASSGVVVQFRHNTFNVVSTSDNPDNFLQTNVSWPWDMKSFCRKIVETQEKLYVNNAKESEEWSCSPPVSEGPVRSYLGYPLYWPNGSLFGSFCVIDTKKTNYSNSLVEILGQLKLIVESELKHVFDKQKIKALLAEKLLNEELLKQLALYDSLTGCANRNLLNERFTYELAKADRNHATFSIAYLDLDKFKPINDDYGHAAGDAVLTGVADRIKQVIRSHDLVARVGGDEFVILFNNRINKQKIKEKLLEKISDPIHYQSYTIHASVSIGVATYPKNGKTLDELMKVADAQMYSEKMQKNNQLIE